MAAFNGAGLELDAVGNLWTVGQGSGNAYLIESGLPTFSDVPWLTIDPTEATVAPDGEIDIHLDVDTTGLLPGVHRAIAVLQTNDPDHSTVQVPIILVVPAYQQGIDAGGGASGTRTVTPTPPIAPTAAGRSATSGRAPRARPTAPSTGRPTTACTRTSGSA